MYNKYMNSKNVNSLFLRWQTRTWCIHSFVRVLECKVLLCKNIYIIRLNSDSNFQPSHNAQKLAYHSNKTYYTGQSGIQYFVLQYNFLFTIPWYDLLLNVPVNSYGHVGMVNSSNHTSFLGKLEQAVNQYFVHILLLVTDNNPS